MRDRMMRSVVILGLSFLGAWGAGGSCFADVYTIDPAHSSLGFAAKHLMVSTVTGEFTGYSGTVQFDPTDPAKTEVSVTIEVKSIDTRVPDRDKHLKGTDFFDAETFPQITFKSTGVTEVKMKNGYVILGDLTMHGVTQKISIPATIEGPIKSPFGTEVIGVSAEFTINRQDYGISYNKQLDNGGWMVSNDVKISVNLEASKK